MAIALDNDRASARDRQSARQTVRIMLVDDSLTVRTIFSRMIERENDMTIVATASTAEQGLVEIRRQQVDVILLDLEMPGMGGIEALPKMLRASPDTKVLVISSLTAEGAEHSVKALRMGAADTMLKPRTGGFTDDYREQLLAKIRALKGLAPYEAPREVGSKFNQRSVGKRPQVIAIGASTGGIHALNLFLRQIPKNFELPILITQHLPESFIPVFAKQMEMAAERPAVLAARDTEIRRGMLVIAPGNGHMVVRNRHGRMITDISTHPATTGCTPSVDPMFESLAEAYEGKVAGVLLSGMGRDGTEGADAIIAAGGSVYTQSADSCAVWGMPRDITERGLASAILPPAALADKILSTAGADAWR